jgi:uncharacterized membrane protein
MTWLELLTRLLAPVCGQNPDHTWAPGGLPLPCCQRCLGLYAGAGVALCLHWWRRPKLSGRFLEAHGAFLLLMLPFGCHWLPQGPVLRALAGVLFGFGVATFLWLPLSGRVFLREASRPASQRVFGYALALALTLALAPGLGAAGGKPAAYALAGLVLWGALALAFLVLANAALGLGYALQLARRVRELV